MAYAKLSGALLVRKDAPVTEIVSVPHSPADAAPAAAPSGAPAPAPSVAPADAERQLARHLKALNLPTFLSHYAPLARQFAEEGLDPSRYLLRLAEMELGERQRQVTARRIKAARFPAVKELAAFDFSAVPALDRGAVLDLAKCDYIARNENVVAVGNSGTGKTHLAIALGVAACRQGFSVRFITAASLVHEMLEASDERRLLRLQRRLAGCKLLIIDELAYAPLSTLGADLLFDIVSQRYERGSTIITSSLPFQEWINVFGTAQLTGAVLDRLTHHAHILEMPGESFRLKQSREQRRGPENRAP
ncbi:MAG TPA: IS21-like element helper ATPase IstB [Stellaceae bacterium]|nr:IS21-like element helper ATPase IstB [Stellaceae bacterium]